MIVGLDIGATAVNATVLDDHGGFLVDGMCELPSRVADGPAATVGALVALFDHVLGKVGSRREQVTAVGLGSPGPASATGVISSRGATNFSQPEWHGVDLRAAAERALGVPVVYSNDGNAAALYAHEMFFGELSAQRSSVSVIVGTGLGGGVVVGGAVVAGTSGMAGELGHVPLPMAGLLAEGQPVPRCNCGLEGDAESVASLTAIGTSLLPFWLAAHPGHELATVDLASAARRLRSYAERGDPLARAVFAQQAMAIGRLLTILANVLDPDAYFVGGGVVDADAAFREWFLARVRAEVVLREEQAAASVVGVVTDLDMAGARGAALVAARTTSAQTSRVRNTS